MLTLGYKLDNASQHAYTASCVSNTHLNTIVAALATGDEYYALYRRLGADTFAHMLLSTSFFAPVAGSRDAFVQMWGVPLSDVRPRRATTKRAAPVHTPRRKRRRRGVKPEPTQTVEPHSGQWRSDALSDVYFGRGKIFYARACVVFRFGIVLGLPPKHVFNTSATPRGADAPVPPGVFRRKSAGPLTTAEIRERTHKVCRRMWPMQFRMPPAWAHDKHANARKSASWHGRLPKRLSRARQLVDRMLRRHDRFNYHAVLNACCPHPLRRGRPLSASRAQVAQHFAGGPLQADARLPDAEPEQNAPETQVPCPGHHDRGLRLQQVRQRSSGQPRFYQYATSQGRVRARAARR